MKNVSVIVRTKNEEEWVSLCLKGIKDQTTEREIEVVLVDNLSTDATVKKAVSAWPGLTYVEIDQYKPGDSLNRGIAKAKNEIIVCISAHCIPANKYWLEALCCELELEGVCGVYGRQIPLESTEKSDARDMWITFGLDRRVQIKDPFFHNANSAFYKSTWEELPFDAQLTNLEDRVWGKMQIDKGNRIIYTPEAVVFHHHGIHQNGNNKRCDGVVDVMMNLHSNDAEFNGFENPYKYQKSLIVVPISKRYGVVDKLGLEQAAPKLKEEKGFDILVLPDSDNVAEFAQSQGFYVPYTRKYTDPAVVPPLIDDLAKLLEHLESMNKFYDYIAVAEMIYPNRRVKLFTEMRNQLRKIGADSIVAAWPEKRPIMVESSTGLNQRYDDYKHSYMSRRPVYIGVPGLGVITKPQLIREGRLISEETAIFEVQSWSEIKEKKK
ncbi:glycosyltransferase [Teredinibacter sp. KSP-S5-2]|uniref:glycosyltransferase n=1 Tax=Teredinibacter sp. KSP-S5-2 TaxID=3034506 RepID=UPI002935193A|nr:glycosyltransferase [Teredinibacter sp. KSP-S5-2]WNO07859.1 glycosyltransferase [Teredinibacter sp. KSP-S5-2]